MVSGDLDLWTMDLNGLNKKQLTNRLGYDGGAFYSPDVKKMYGEHILQKQKKK